MNNLELANRQFQALFPIDDIVIALFKECTPKILVVTDGTLSFGTAEFGLSDFINTIKTTPIHGMTPIVKTAHRGGSAADYTNFTFTSSTLSKSQYDVLFLFGIRSGGSLPQAELDVIAQFMNQGGGVFATGDHATLGKEMCGDIPRVRGMRRWDGPSASTANRLSTNDPGTDNVFELNDQSDSIPQKIYPAYYGDAVSSQPHALLQHPSKRIIEVLPDHPHESECTVPDAAALENADEWPVDDSGNTVEPKIVALSMSYGGGFTGPSKEPIHTPRAFGAIAAYDGHLAEVGRICTDATWHHFVNINLINTSKGTGIKANADAYDRISTYYGNIANWLMPKRVRRCLRWPLIATICKLYPIAEFIPQLLEQPRDLPTLLDAGKQTRATLSRFVSKGQQRELIHDLYQLHSDDLAKQMVRSHRQISVDLTQEISLRMTPVELLEDAALGALLLTAARALPADQDLRASLKEAGGINGLDARAKKTLASTFKNMRKELGKGCNQLGELIERL